MSGFQLPQLPAELLESLPEVVQQYIQALHGLIGAQQQVIDKQLPPLQKHLEELQLKLSQYAEYDTETERAPGQVKPDFKRPAKTPKARK